MPTPGSRTYGPKEVGLGTDGRRSLGLRIGSLACLVIGLFQSPAARAQSAAGSDPLRQQLIAVFGEPALVDTTMAILANHGYRVADRSPAALTEARRQGRELEPAKLAIVMQVRPDPSGAGHRLIAELLDVQAIRRLHRTWVPLATAGAVATEQIAAVVLDLLGAGRE